MRSSTRTCSETHQNELIPLLLSVFSVILLIDTINASNNVRYAAKPYKARQTHVRTRFSSWYWSISAPRGSFETTVWGRPSPSPTPSSPHCSPLSPSPPLPPLPYSPRPPPPPTPPIPPSRRPHQDEPPLEPDQGRAAARPPRLQVRSPRRSQETRRRKQGNLGKRR